MLDEMSSKDEPLDSVARGEVFGPPQARGHRSVARVLREWYVACRSEELRSGAGRGKHLRPVVIAGTPLVLFRDGAGRAAALLDRCPHRNVPLSLGRVAEDGTLECGYHGWRFSGAGTCTAVPGLCRPLERAHEVAAYETLERDGFVWVCPAAGCTPERPPLRLPALSDARYEHVVREVEVRATLHATVENALDVPHTGYLHRGLFRGGKRNRIRAVVRRFRGHVETEYLGEPKPPGVVAKILAPHGSGVVRHWDRFFLPGVAQVEYALGEDTHFLVTSFCTPVSDFHTRMFAVASFRTPLPGALVRSVLEPVALRIFGQDAAVLARQTEVIQRHGGEQFISTEVDVMGPPIWRLLREAERAEEARQSPPQTREGDEPVVHEIELEV